MSRSTSSSFWARSARRLLGSAALAALLSPAFASAADTVQDFSANFPPPPPPTPITFAGVAHFETGSLTSTPGGSFARITNDGVGANGSIGLSQFAGQVGAYDSLKFEFDFRMNDAATGADGFSFKYLPVSANGISGASPIIGEEPNLAGTFGIGFDSWNNDDATDGTSTGLGGVDGSLPDSFSLHWNGSKVAGAGDPSGSVSTLALGLPADWLENSNTKHATITITPGVGGQNVHLLVTEPSTGMFTNPFGPTGVLVPGMTQYDGRVGFSGRTGGENQNQDVDNLVATFDPAGAGAPIVGTQDFNTTVAPPPPPSPTLLGGTPFSPQHHGGAGPNGSIQPTFGALPGGGDADGHYQLTPNVGDTLNSIAFDRTLPTLHAGDTVNGSFDIRVQDSNGATADGLSFLMLDTTVYGETGPLATTVGVSEDPNNANSVSLGFDTFDNDEDFAAGDPLGCGGPVACTERRANSISAHANGVQLDQQFLPNVEYDDGNWINIQFALSVLDNGSGGLGGFLDVIATDTVTGNSFIAFSGLPIASVPANMRFAFGARTGGEADAQSVDNVNISVTPVPEPSTFVLFGLAAGGLYVLRRRRK
jgi:hypothetical protein